MHFLTDVIDDFQGLKIPSNINFPNDFSLTGRIEEKELWFRVPSIKFVLFFNKVL